MWFLDGFVIRKWQPYKEVSFVGKNFVPGAWRKVKTATNNARLLKEKRITRKRKALKHKIHTPFLYYHALHTIAASVVNEHNIL